MRLVIVRHADPEYSVDGLTESGHLEAKALAERFGSGYDGSITKIYTSPKGRARATAKYTEDILGMEAAVEDWTQELSYWFRLDQNARPGEGGMALWDMPGEFIRSFEPPLTIESQWEELEDMGKVSPQASAHESRRTLTTLCFFFFLVFFFFFWFEW
uniref:Phosphoglycerate mutase n=1 Tax=Rhodosorus marinus TaxID=101924 RepID=A0A7S2ZJZ8_9RHOD|mmetsp:Transcript_21109/g.86178  ORF Transcript_21109/g.86178 Transcript_21109/m.86178 type:complete len:158 (+) Transcript_21109:151-624(+)